MSTPNDTDYYTGTGAPLCYLGGPIDFVGHDINAERYRQVRDDIDAWLTEDGFITYRPDRAFGGTSNSSGDGRIEPINQAALDACDLMVALLPTGVPAIGTVFEIEATLRASKPVVVLGGTGSHALAATAAILIDEPEQVTKVARELWQSGQLERKAAGRMPLPFLMDEGCDAYLPTRHYADDAGLDLFVTQSRTISSGEFADVPCGCRVQLPPGVWGLVLGRSSTLRRRGLFAAPGVIDTGYRGEMFTAVYNFTDHILEVSPGERLGQLILFNNVTADYAPVPVGALDSHPRGERGFGSTGR